MVRTCIRVRAWQGLAGAGGASLALLCKARAQGKSPAIVRNLALHQQSLSHSSHRIPSHPDIRLDFICVRSDKACRRTAARPDDAMSVPVAAGDSTHAIY